MSNKLEDKSDIHKTLLEKIPGLSTETISEVLDVIEALTHKKKKKEINPQERILALKKNALNFINSNYMKFIILQEGEGYYIIAHSKKIKVLIEKLQSVFQPFEKTEEKDFCCVTLIQYDNFQKKEIKSFLDVSCEIIYIN